MNESSPDLVFALDIGTRSVVGLILEKRLKGYHVLDVYSLEHEERSMLDGQIHNVLAVAEVISQVKEFLEGKYGLLTKVCVAAAGRSLKTKRASEQIDIKGKTIFDKPSILHLELSAVQKAQFQLANETNASNYKVTDYCVGYSVIDYRLDNEPIGSLVDQRGDTASVEVIATFLPKVVVESLISALQRTNLELEALTLEPIAAINVLIPPSMRRLNVALVDIGAGTSDIAITDYGTVTAYGMVPTAGDEITEALSDLYLLDFPDAEKIKRELSTKDEVVLTDILGMETYHSKDDIVASIDNSIYSLAEKISDEILALNGKTPKAVMLVGGGSMTPGLTDKIAEHLQLPANRVAIRGIDAIKGLTFEHEYEATPELVTPIGIAIAAKETPVEYISIKVNDQPVRLFDIKKLTVGDGLLSSGQELTKLFGKPGMAMMIKFNDRVVTIPGEHGTPPILRNNGQDTELDSALVHGDVIGIEKGSSGKDATGTIEDLVDTKQFLTIDYNGDQVNIPFILYKNGEITDVQEPLADRDVIEYVPPSSVKDVITFIENKEPSFDSEGIQVFLNDQAVTLFENKTTIFINDKEASYTTPIKNSDSIKIKEDIHENILLKTALEKVYEPANREIIVTFNNQPVHLEKDLYECFRDKELLTAYSQLRHEDKITVSKKESVSFIFQDVFSKVHIDRSNTKSKKPVLIRNNNETTFSSDIHHGDTLELNWVDIN
ncbi:cell division protein FtsA [Salipaludibacillus sp. CF4.18]|uniref:cell division protein FtsA n=1 Tax=Salipaludibacillus sp. CF4.18 TaxID=3373081 RepID=UPI003EE597DC